MRASELTGAPVVDTDGQVRGRVVDIRTELERAPGGALTLLVDGFIVATHDWRLFGYERPTEQRPILLRWIVHLMHRDTRYAEWDEVEVDEDAVRLRREWNRLPRLADL